MIFSQALEIVWITAKQHQTHCNMIEMETVLVINVTTVQGSTTRDKWVSLPNSGWVACFAASENRVVDGSPLEKNSHANSHCDGVAPMFTVSSNHFHSLPPYSTKVYTKSQMCCWHTKSLTRFWEFISCQGSIESGCICQIYWEAEFRHLILLHFEFFTQCRNFNLMFIALLYSLPC